MTGLPKDWPTQGLGYLRTGLPKDWATQGLGYLRTGLPKDRATSGQGYPRTGLPKDWATDWQSVILYSFSPYRPVISSQKTITLANSTLPLRAFKDTPRRSVHCLLSMPHALMHYGAIWPVHSSTVLHQLKLTWEQLVLTLQLHFAISVCRMCVRMCVRACLHACLHAHET